MLVGRAAVEAMRLKTIEECAKAIAAYNSDQRLQDILAALKDAKP
jgi:hypothetical protein